jgi:hypothetical protein
MEKADTLGLKMGIGSKVSTRITLEKERELTFII